MASALRVLFVADGSFEVGAVVDALRRGDLEPTWTRVDNEATLRAELREPGPQIILFDHNLQHLEVVRALEVAQEFAPDTPLIVLAAPTNDASVEAASPGAADHLTNEDLPRLPAAVTRALRHADARRAQRAAERRFHGLLENLPIGIVLHRDRRILYANPICLRYFGVDRLEDLKGRDPLALATPADRGRLREELVRLHIGQPLQPLETELLRADGTSLPIEVVSFRPDVEGDPDVITLVRDISRERDMQNRLLVADRMVSMGALAAGVAHEINNPITYVLGNLDVALESLSQGEPDAQAIRELREALQEAREGTSRVRLIVRDLKAFSHPDEERIEAIDLRPVLESAMSVAFSEIRLRARLIKELGPVPLVLANAARLGQVFLNLLINAAQAIPEGAADRNEIRVSTMTDEMDRAIVAIADTGSGIALDVRRRIFDPFFTTKPIGVGTGLGLTICQRIVRSLDGKIDVWSEPGQGTEFRVALPAADLAVARAAEASLQVDGRRARILSIDSDPLVGNAVKRMLPMHEVVTLQSGSAALEYLAAGNRYDVVLCALAMPDTSGMDVYAEMTKIDPGLAARVIFITDGANTPATLLFLEHVENLRLEKPFNAASLRTLVRSQLG